MLKSSLLPEHERTAYFVKRRSLAWLAHNDHPDVGVSRPVKQPFREGGTDMDAAVRCGVGIALMNRFATVVKQRKIHVSFAGGGRELATAVFPQPARRHRKYADRGQKPGPTTYTRVKPARRGGFLWKTASGFSRCCRVTPKHSRDRSHLLMPLQSVEAAHGSLAVLNIQPKADCIVASRSRNARRRK